MADPVDELLAELMARFTVLHGSTVEHKIDEPEWNETGTSPRIGFIETSGTFVGERTEPSNAHDDDPDADPDDGPGGAVGAQRPDIDVHAWGRTKEEARQILHRLFLASKEIARFGISWGGYRKRPIHHLDNGVEFVATLHCEVDVPANTPATSSVARVESYEVTTSLEATGSTDVTFTNPSEA